MENSRSESSETLRNKCAACFRQYNKLEHLVEHMKTSYHSFHEPKCGICNKHCKSFESLREHLIGPLPKAECAKIFSQWGCNLCLNVFDGPNALRIHRGRCQFSRTPGLASRMSQMSLFASSEDFRLDARRPQGPQVVALACKMVGGGSDGSIDICARVCLIDEDENIIFHTYLKPQIPVTNYRYQTTGIRPEHLTDAMPLKHAQRKIQDFLCNGESLWKIRSKGGKARILVGHGLDHDLDCLGIEYPSILIRDTATYTPLMKTNKLCNTLKYLTQAYLGQVSLCMNNVSVPYDIQTGIQDPYEDCVAAMRIYFRMRSQVHLPYPGCGGGHTRGSLASLSQKDLEKMTPAAMLQISTTDYYCWCLDS